MVDSTEHLDLIEEAATSFVAPIRVAIDIDLSWRPLGGIVKVGARRSPIRTADEAVALAQEIERRDRTKLVGALAYEAQIAGIRDNVPGKAINNMVVRRMQAASAKDVEERRAEIVTALSEVAQLEFVNGGGTGSIELSASEWAVTEIGAGSGFYAPVHFDHYRSFRPRPAAMFALPVTRSSGVGVEVHGAERALPQARSHGLQLGDRVYFRDLRAGDLCERFDRLFLVTGTTIRDEVPTYLGEGKSFI
jgi:D-serine deaminase-like pyridoxal phosphate-dependent protein